MLDNYTVCHIVLLRNYQTVSFMQKQYFNLKMFGGKKNRFKQFIIQNNMYGITLNGIILVMYM